LQTLWEVRKNQGENTPASLTNNALNRRVEIIISIAQEGNRFPGLASYAVKTKLVLDKIYFKPDEAVLEPAAVLYLHVVANQLQSYKDDHFEIRGHVNWVVNPASANDSGYRRKMFALSAARAKAVFDFLVDQGIAAERMAFKGMGNSEMIYPNPKNNDEKRMNMRVEILIMKND